MKKYLLYIILLISILYSCARITAPTGGPKDEDPPVLKVATPAHQSTNVKPEQLTLTFDEAVKVDDLNNQLIIAPYLDKNIIQTELRDKLQTVIIKLEQELSENTTYTFNFRESIKDISESNPAENLIITFSTGDYLDSLSLEGKVNFAISQTTKDPIIVGLYRASDTLDVFTGKPTYIAIVDDFGQYKFENLKPDNYRLYAFADKNKNLQAEFRSEPYGFFKDTLSLNENTTDVNIQMIRADISKIEIRRAAPRDQYFDITLSKSVNEVKFDTTQLNQSIYYSFNDDRKILRFYKGEQFTYDSLGLNLHFEDSIKSTLDTLVYVKFEETDKKVSGLTLKAEKADNSIVKPNYFNVFNFSKPIKYFNPDSLFAQFDSLTKIDFKEATLKWNENLTSLTISQQLPLLDSITKFSLEIRPGAFIAVDGDTLEKTTIRHQKFLLEKMGDIKGNIQIEAPNFIIQLLNKDKVIRELFNQKTYHFAEIPAGSYQIRVIIDENNNGKWDVGNINRWQTPEKIQYFVDPKTSKQDIQVRENWEVIDINITVDTN